VRRYAALIALLWGCSEQAPTEPLRFSQSVEGPRGYIVVLKSGNAPSHAKRVYRHALNGYATDMTEVEAVALRKNPSVISVTEEVEFTTSETWGLDRIDQRQLPLDNTYSTDRTGTGVTVYIVDTGIRTSHTEFTGRAMWGFSIDGTTEACHGHGTHVAGTVGGVTYGVAKNVSLVAVKVFSGCDTVTPTSYILAGLDWVAQNRSLPCVVNMSLGGGADLATDEAVRGVIASGCTVSVSAGNSNLDACFASPARTPEALTVGSIDWTDTKSSFSNWGDCVDLFAPGSAITAAWNTSDVATAQLNGTSMASPHVAGVAALILEGSPNLSPAGVQDSVKAYSTKNVVRNAQSQNWNILYSGRVVDGSYVPPPLPPIPRAPTNLNVDDDPFHTGDLGQLIFWWYDNSDNEGYFELVMWTDEGDSTGVNCCGGPGFSANIYFHVFPGHWNAKVRAVNNGGASSWSNTVRICVPGGSVICGAPPPPPDTVTPPDTTAPPPVPCRLRGKSGKCK
jgi:subtilisin family serine protease